MEVQRFNSSIELIKLKIDSTNDILDELTSKFENTLKLQEKVLNEQHEVLHCQEKILHGYQSKVNSMEQEVIFTSHISTLYERLLDDQDQNTRKRNLRIEGIEIFDHESPDILLSFLKSEVKKVGLKIREVEFKQAFRAGKVYTKDGNKHQNIILKMKSSLGRNMMYIKSKRFKFEVYPDLTANRQKILTFAKEQLLDLGIDMCSVHVDLDCKLQLKTKCGKTHGFSSQSEFLSLISRFSNTNKSSNFM